MKKKFLATIIPISGKPHRPKPLDAHGTAKKSTPPEQQMGGRLHRGKTGPGIPPGPSDESLMDMSPGFSDLWLITKKLTTIIREDGQDVALDELAAVFAFFARDLAELSLSGLPECIEKDEALRRLRRFLCEKILEKSKTLGRFS